MREWKKNTQTVATTAQGYRGTVGLRTRAGLVGHVSNVPHGSAAGHTLSERGASLVVRGRWFGGLESRL
jgi:hypothetical protein